MIVQLLARIFLGVLFILSAVLKFFPIDSFEYLLVQKSITNWVVSPILARILIGLELFLGGSLLFRLYSLKWIARISLILLLFFSIFLAIDLWKFGIQENCGCMGDAFPINTMEGLVKNVLCISLLFFLLYHPQKSPEKTFGNKKIRGLLTLCLFAAPFIIRFLPELPRNPERMEERLSSEVNSLLLKSENQTPPDYLVFLSSSCSHCINVLQKLSIQSQQTTLNCHLIIGEDLNKTKDFLLLNTANFNYSLVPQSQLNRISFGWVPSIQQVKNDSIKYIWIGESFNPSDLVKN
ncbi:MAG: hypothetical protein ACI9YL_000637 [Luteibaculaceae bacterium]|jgi:hypothetical protein